MTSYDASGQNRNEQEVSALKAEFQTLDCAL